MYALLYGYKIKIKEIGNMPGYFIHLGVCNEEALKDRGFVLGVEAPDMLKKHVKVLGIDGAKEKYNELKVSGMPEYEELESRINEKEEIGNNGGLHYGVSSKPGIKEYWSSLTDDQKKESFYKGYLWHLITDKKMYEQLDLDNKFKVVLECYNGDDIDSFKRQEVKKLHSDWDKTNELIKSKYGVELTPEVDELKVVGFNSDTNLSYVDWDIVRGVIDELRNINPLDCDLEDLVSKL